MSGSILRVRAVSRAFGGLKAVDEVSFDVQAGQVLAVIGPNGAGKSTLMKLVSGFERPDSGSVVLDDMELTGLKPFRIARAGVVRTFQDNVVFPDNTPVDALIVAQQGGRRANMMAQMLGTRRARSERSEMMAMAYALLEDLDLSRLAQVSCSAMSHGHLRRVSMAMALAAKPRIILLDEPFAGLNDTETTSAMHFVRRIAREKNVGIVLVEHDMRAVMEISDQICVLNQGRPIAEGNPDEIRADPAVIEAYLGTYGTGQEVLA